jgi:thiamine-monophosphate kinase
MALETDFIAALKAIATDPAARGLADDAALLGDIVLTHDMIVEGVHFLSTDSPQDIAWKLVAVNLSDLAAKGARPLGVLTGAGLTADADWNAKFVDGLGIALAHWDVPLLGGDTVAMPKGAPRAFGLTALGRASGPVPARSGGRVGDTLYVVGVIGDAGLGLAIAQGELTGPDKLVNAYRRPQPLLAEGSALASYVHAMMDVSDGLLIDAQRLGVASGTGVAISLDSLPLSDEARLFGQDRAARLRAATAGDDYALLFSASGDLPPDLPPATAIGRLTEGAGLRLYDEGIEIALPAKLGWLHQG